jgi:hypothetical protein
MDSFDRVAKDTLWAFEVRAVQEDEAAHALYRIDQHIREKLRLPYFTSSIDVTLKLSHASITKIQKLLNSRGFHTIASESSVRSNEWSLHVRWAGAGCPD